MVASSARHDSSSRPAVASRAPHANPSRRGARLLRALLPRDLPGHPDCALALLDEIRLASRLRHPNLAPALGLFAENGELFVVGEKPPGETLADVIDAASTADGIPLKVALAIAADVLSGLEAAHDAGMVHGGVVPGEVFVGPDGVTRVAGLGRRALLPLESADEVLARVAYLAPEQLGKRAVDRRADIYSAAAIVWELFAGRRLVFKGDALRVLVDKMLRPVERPSLHREDLPDALDAVTLHGLECDPARRFASASSMSAALARYGVRASAAEVAAWIARNGAHNDARADDRDVEDADDRDVEDVHDRDSYPESGTRRTSNGAEDARGVEARRDSSQAHEGAPKVFLMGMGFESAADAFAADRLDAVPPEAPPPESAPADPGTYREWPPAGVRDLIARLRGSRDDE